MFMGQGGRPRGPLGQGWLWRAPSRPRAVSSEPLDHTFCGPRQACPCRADFHGGRSHGGIWCLRCSGVSALPGTACGMKWPRDPGLLSADRWSVHPSLHPSCSLGPVGDTLAMLGVGLQPSASAPWSRFTATVPDPRAIWLAWPLAFPGHWGKCPAPPTKLFDKCPVGGFAYRCPAQALGHPIPPQAPSPGCSALGMWRWSLAGFQLMAGSGPPVPSAEPLCPEEGRFQ